jgi:hypothetical protein
MRVLRHVVVPLIAVCVLGVTGCSQIDKSLGQTQALVSFQDGTSVAVRLHVRAACAKLPDVSAVPLPSGIPLQSSLSQVEYQISNASDVNEARLEECLSKFPSVAGMNLQDSSDTGS